MGQGAVHEIVPFVGRNLGQKTRMVRRARIDVPGAVHQTICRGIERGVIFRGGAHKSEFIGCLSVIFRETATPCYAQ
jgi:hypothetical protein